jgi:hypothetical protein
MNLKEIARSILEQAKTSLISQGEIDSVILLLTPNGTDIIPLTFEDSAEKQFVQEIVFPYLVRERRADVIIIVMDALFKQVGVFEQEPKTLYGDPGAVDCIMVTAASRHDKISVLTEYYPSPDGVTFGEDRWEEDRKNIRDAWIDNIKFCDLPPSEFN